VCVPGTSASRTFAAEVTSGRSLLYIANFLLRKSICAHGVVPPAALYEASPELSGSLTAAHAGILIDALVGLDFDMADASGATVD
jgi:hypothetical protein